MKKIVLLVIGLLFLPVIALAYQVNIDAPETLTVGKPLVVTGVTTFPPGMSVDVVLYYQLTTTTEIKRQVVGIKPDNTFKVVFDTTGLKTGTYKVEVPVNGMGDSVTMRLVQIVDRSDEIQMDSPLTPAVYRNTADRRDQSREMKIPASRSRLSARITRWYSGPSLSIPIMKVHFPRMCQSVYPGNMK